MTHLFTSFILFLSLTGMGSSTLTEWKTHSHKNYSIEYPENWELSTEGKNGAAFILLSAPENDKDLFRENINLGIQDLQGQNYTLDSYTKLSEEQVKTLITNSKILSSERIKTSKGEYHKLVYTGEMGVFKLRFEQIYLFKGEKAYVLTFTSEQSRFDSFKETGERIMNSFAIQESIK